MESVKENLRRERENQGISYAELSKKTGIAKSTLQRYETGATLKIPLEAIIKIAAALDIPPARLMGWEDDKSNGQPWTVKIPVYKKLQAGCRMSDNSGRPHYTEITYTPQLQGEFYACIMDDDSMAPRININDIVIIRKQDDAQNGDLVLVRIGSGNPAIKKLVKQDNGIMLLSLNSSYLPMFYTFSQIAILPVEILGKVVELRGRL